MLHPLIDWTRAPDDLLSRLLEQDSAMAKSGSYYALVVARPKRGLRRLVAAAPLVSRAEGQARDLRDP